jgi:alpha-L-arabinofuranosidase
MEVTVSLHGSTAVSGTASTLTSANADDVNSAAEPDRVCPAPVEAPSGEELTLQLAPKSTTVGEWELR